MRDYIAKVTQISLVNYKIISISCESGIHFSPGQYFLLDKIDRPPQNLVRQIIYPMSTGQNEYSFKLPMIEDNQLDFYPGDQLRLFGPLGRGIQIATGTNRILYASYLPEMTMYDGLLSYIKHPRQSLTIFTEHTQTKSENLYNIQFIDAEELEQHFLICDVCILEINKQYQVDQFIKICKSPPPKGLSKMQIFIQTNMPCHSLGNCGLCDFWVGEVRYCVCKDGPVIHPG